MADLPVLNDIDQRVLGALLEKEITVPASYPLTLNGLRTACNQTTSREPVSDYDERQIESTLSDLKLRGLVRFEHTATGARVMKYRQLLVERLGLGSDERAVLTVLLLRGTQSAGEIATRTERLFQGFCDAHDVEECLHRMASGPAPLVRELPKRPGWRGPRWVHVLGTDLPTAPPVASDDLMQQPAPTDPAVRDERVLATYAIVASSYSEMLLDELDHKPFDRWLLSRIAERTAGTPVVDLGCGPGHVTNALAADGARVTGVDNSPAMLAKARTHFPSLPFIEADLRDGPPQGNEGPWGGVVAWYAFVHLTMPEVADAIRCAAEQLPAGGTFTMATHVGPEVRHVDEWWGHQVDIDFIFHDPRTVRAAITAAGLTIDEWYVRSPLADVEAATDRLYVVARRH